MNSFKGIYRGSIWVLLKGSIGVPRSVTVGFWIFGFWGLGFRSLCGSDPWV